MRAILSVTLNVIFALALMSGATDGKEASGKTAIAFTNSATAAESPCDNIGTDLLDLLKLIDDNKAAIKTAKNPEYPKGSAIGERLDDARARVVALQKILQPAGYGPNHAVLYAYAVNVQAFMGETIVILMDVRARIMSTVAVGGGNKNARPHYDLITVTIARAERVLVKGGHCYLNFGK